MLVSVIFKFYPLIPCWLLQIELKKNYRSTRCIVEAASSLIHHNVKRCQLKQVETDNSAGCRVSLSKLCFYDHKFSCVSIIHHSYEIWCFNSLVLHIIQITIKECHTEDAQCAFVIDKILEITSECSVDKCSFSNVAILYRRQVKM